MKVLQKLFQIRDGGTIEAHETNAVDAALSKAKCSDIPKDQVDNVTNYINTELLHNVVPCDVKEGMERLLGELKLNT